MDSLNLSILQGQIVGANFTIELLIDKINKSNPKGDWLDIVNDLKKVVETNKRVSLALYNSLELSNTLNKAIKLDFGTSTNEVLNKLLKLDVLESENKRLKNEIKKML